MARLPRRIVAGMHIQIDDISPIETYTVGGAPRSSFPVPFSYFENTDLVVTVGSTTLTLTDYTVSGTAVDAGFSSGTVTLETAVVNTIVVVERIVPIKRTTDFPNSGPFSIPALNTQFDKIIAICQQLYAGLAAALVTVADALALFESVNDTESNTHLYATRTALVAATVGASVSFVRTEGYASVGDDGGALYKRVVAEPSHGGKAQSADGAWWELFERVVNPYMFGAIGDNVTNDTDALDDWFEYIAATGAEGDLLDYDDLFKFSTKRAWTAGLYPIRIGGRGMLCPTSALNSGDKVCIELDGGTAGFAAFHLEDFGLMGVPNCLAGSGVAGIEVSNAPGSIFRKIRLGERTAVDTTRYFNTGIRFFEASGACVVEDPEFYHIHGDAYTASNGFAVPATADWSANKISVIRPIMYDVGHGDLGGAGHLFQALAGNFEGFDTSSTYQGIALLATTGASITHGYMEEMGGKSPILCGTDCYSIDVEYNVFGKAGVDIANLYGGRFGDNNLYRTWVRFDATTCRDIDYCQAPGTYGGLSFAFSGNSATGSPIISNIAFAGPVNGVAGLVIAGLVDGMVIAGSGITVGSKILSHDANANTITLDQNATTTVAPNSFTATDIVGLIGDLPNWPVTLQNSWTADTAQGAIPGYRMHRDGTVELIGGFTKPAGAIVLNQIIWTAHSVDYAPSRVARFPVACSDGTCGVVELRADGTLRIVAMTATNGTSISVNGIRFAPR